MPERPIRILFVCTGNSARSQMAEGFARHYGKGLVEASSAGLEPRGLNPFAVRVMAEEGIDISSQRSKALEISQAERMDVVITVCGNAEERCPVLPPPVKRLHWPIEDPARFTGTEEETLARFRAIRDEIKARVLDLLEGLKAGAS